jgi:hypothetical protein
VYHVKGIPLTSSFFPWFRRSFICRCWLGLCFCHSYCWSSGHHFHFLWALLGHMALCLTVEALSFLEQCLPFFICQEGCSIVLSSPWLLSATASSCDVDCIDVHHILISLPILSFAALQGLLPLITCIVLKKGVGEGGFIFCVSYVMCSRCLVPPLECLWAQMHSFYDSHCQGSFQSSPEHEDGSLCIWFPACSFSEMMESGYICIQIFPLHLNVDEVQGSPLPPRGVHKGFGEFLYECVPHMFIIWVGHSV